VCCSVLQYVALRCTMSCDDVCVVGLRDDVCVAVLRDNVCVAGLR